MRNFAIVFSLVLNSQPNLHITICVHVLSLALLREASNAVIVNETLMNEMGQLSSCVTKQSKNFSTNNAVNERTAVIAIIL